MLMSDVKVGLGHFRGQHEPVILAPVLIPQFLKGFGAQHPAQRVRGVDCAVDQDVDDVDALGLELGVERLAEHAPAPHGCRMRVLPTVAAYGCGRRGDQDRSLAALLHPGADGRGLAGTS